LSLWTEVRSADGVPTESLEIVHVYEEVESS